MSSIDVATWIQAIGSAGSLLAFAAWVGIAVINRRDEFEARFARQAQTVAAWLDLGSHHDCEEDYVVCLLNGGDAPIFRCEAIFRGLIERGEPSSVYMSLLPPRTTRCLSTPASLEDLESAQVYSTGVAPELRFIDTSGRSWHRDGEGKLKNVTQRSRLRPRRNSQR